MYEVIFFKNKLAAELGKLVAKLRFLDLSDFLAPPPPTSSPSTTLKFSDDLAGELTLSFEVDEAATTLAWR